MCCRLPHNAQQTEIGGTAVILNTNHLPHLNLRQKPEAQWSRLIAIQPGQLNLRCRNGWGYSETIDIEM